MKMTRTEAARKGGQAVYHKYGSDYMANLGRKGAEVFWQRHYLVKAGTHQFAIVRKEDQKVIGYI